MNIIDSTTNLIIFEEVIITEELNSSELYSALKEWFVTRFKNADAVLHMDDRESGKFIGKAYVDLEIGKFNTRRTDFTIKILIKEGRFKYILTDFVQNLPIQNATLIPLEDFVVKKLYNKKGKLVKGNARYKEEVIKFSQLISEDLKNAIKTISEQDDW